jgi:hypothetical protein
MERTVCASSTRWQELVREYQSAAKSLIYRHLGLKMLVISRFILTSPRCYCDLAVNLGGWLWTGKITKSYANNSTFERRDTECADEEIAVRNSQHDYSLSLVSSSAPLFPNRADLPLSHCHE